MTTLTDNRSRVATTIVDCDSHIVPVIDTDSIIDLLPTNVSRSARTMYVEEAKMWAGTQTLLGKDGQPDPLRDPAARISILDQQLGVDTQVLIPHGPYAHLYGGLPEGNDKPLPVRIALCKAYNNAVAGIQKDYPGRFIASAIVPFDDLVESEREIRRVTELGIKVIQLPANWVGNNFDTMELYPFWETINELKVPVFVHHIPQSCGGSKVDHVPRYPIIGQDRMRRLHMGVYVGFGLEYALCATALSLGGVLDRFPNLRFCFFEAGAGWLPYTMMGADRSFYIKGECSRTPNRPSELIKAHCFTAIEASEHVPALVQTMGSENFFYGSDFPHSEYAFLPNEVDTYLSVEGISDDDKANILGRTILGVLGDAAM